VGKVKDRIEGMIRFAADINNWDIFELSVQKDHIHLYIGTSPKWSPSQVMKIIKGGTSNKIRKLFPNLDEVYWGSTFWADGFLVKSVGEVTDKVISNYVRNQQRDHY